MYVLGRGFACSLRLLSAVSTFFPLWCRSCPAAWVPRRVVFAGSWLRSPAALENCVRAVSISAYALKAFLEAKMWPGPWSQPHPFPSATTASLGGGLRNSELGTPAIADGDEDKEQESNVDHLAMLKLKYSNVPDRSNPHGPHTLSRDAIRQLPSDSTLMANNW